MARKPQKSWAVLEAEYVNGSMSVRELATSKGVSEPALEKRAQLGKWSEKRRVASVEIGKAASKSAAQLQLDELEAFNKADLALAKNLRALVNAQIRKVLDKAKQAGLEMPDMKATDIRTLASAGAEIQRIGRLALGAATENQQVTGKDGAPLHGNGVAYGVLVVPAQSETGEEWEAMVAREHAEQAKRMLQ